MQSFLRIEPEFNRHVTVHEWWLGVALNRTCIFLKFRDHLGCLWSISSHCCLLYESYHFGSKSNEYATTLPKNCCRYKKITQSKSTNWHNFLKFVIFTYWYNLIETFFQRTPNSQSSLKNLINVPRKQFEQPCWNALWEQWALVFNKGKTC